LDMEAVPASWRDISTLLLHAGQPFADTSLFAVNAVCRLMRQHVTVALSGDGGDEGFGGYDFYWQVARIARLQTFPPIIWNGAGCTLTPMARIGVIPASLPLRLTELAQADDVSIIQNLFCWTREREHRALCRDTDLLPVTRLFEPQWEHHAPGPSRVEKLSMLATEANVRLMLANDFLFKVDIASMRESMEVRVPMLDEDLFEFALSLPHSLKVNGRTGKRVLRAVAHRGLPATVANKPKWGFQLPVDTWLDEDFKLHLRDALLGPCSKLPEFFQPKAYKPIVESFCEQRPCPGISREGLYQRVIMLLSVELALKNSRTQILQ
jgi:asparagine synthase (glutamine-hydrolysing)